MKVTDLKIPLLLVFLSLIVIFLSINFIYKENISQELSINLDKDNKAKYSLILDGKCLAIVDVLLRKDTEGDTLVIESDVGRYEMFFNQFSQLFGSVFTIESLILGDDKIFKMGTIGVNPIKINLQTNLTPKEINFSFSINGPVTLEKKDNNVKIISPKLPMSRGVSKYHVEFTEFNDQKDCSINNLKEFISINNLPDDFA
jgi:hypothetical protein